MNNTMVHPSFWRNKKVFMTGHTGFKGSWLCLWLARMGAKVTGVALPPPTEPSLFQLAKVEKVLERSIMLDIRERTELMRIFRKTSPQIVIHMAAQPLVRASYRNPAATYETNVMGTVNILEAIRLTPGVRAFVNVTSDKCYENLESNRGYRESDRLGGYDPYSSSKACSEIVTAAYRKSFFNDEEKKNCTVAVATARAGNVIGGGDWAIDRLVPDCIRAFANKKNVILRNPDSIRPWQHVLEPLCGYLMLSEKLFKYGKKFASAWNFGPNRKDVLTAREVATAICSEWGNVPRIKISFAPCPHEANLLILDISKTKNELGWIPRWDVRTALSHTIHWYKDYYNGRNVHRLCIDQMENYIRSRT